MSHRTVLYPQTVPPPSSTAVPSAHQQCRCSLVRYGTVLVLVPGKGLSLRAGRGERGLTGPAAARSDLDGSRARRVMIPLAAGLILGDRRSLAKTRRYVDFRYPYLLPNNGRTSSKRNTYLLQGFYVRKASQCTSSKDHTYLLLHCCTYNPQRRYVKLLLAITDKDRRIPRIYRNRLELLQSGGLASFGRQ